MRSLASYWASLSPERTIWASALLGFVIGAFCVPTWVAGIETAQVLAGLVKIPQDLPTYAYHAGAYSFWCNQLPALLMKLGFSDWAASMASSGFELMVAFAGISATALVFFRHGLVALLCPLLFTFMVHPGEHHYMILFLPSIHHGGEVGMYGALLTISLFALGFRRAAFFFLGLMPSAHASLAVLAWAVVGASILFTSKEPLKEARKGAVPLLLGLAFFGVTFAFQKLLVVPSELHSADPRAAAEILRGMTLNWHAHLQPMKWRNFRVDLCVLAYAAYRLYLRPKDVAESERFFLVGVTSIMMVAAAYCAILKIAPGTLAASPLNVLMINRWLNVDTILLPLIGIVMLAKASLEGRALPAAALLGVSALIVFGSQTTLNVAGHDALESHWRGGQLGKLFVDAVYYKRLYYELALLLATALPYMGSSHQRRSPALKSTVTIGLVAFAAGIAGWYLSMLGPRRLSPPPKSPVEILVGRYVRERGAPGVLIPPPGFDPSDAGYVQASSHQAVLLDLGMGQAAYSLSSLVATEEALNSVYGISLRVPGDRARLESGDPRLRALWEERSSAQWAGLANKYHASSVLAPKGWSIRLPAFGNEGAVTLYEIPVL